MPTLDDTREFEVATLNDLLEVEARGGAAAAAGGDGDRYRSWAMLSTGAAGILAVLLVVTLLTGGGGGGGGGGGDVDQPPGTERYPVTVVATNLTSDVKPGAVVSVLVGNAVLASGATVLSVEDAPKAFGVEKKKLELAVKVDEIAALDAEDPNEFRVRSGTLPKAPAPAPAETAPAEQAPAGQAPAGQAPAEPSQTPAPTESAPTPAPRRRTRRRRHRLLQADRAAKRGVCTGRSATCGFSP